MLCDLSIQQQRRQTTNMVFNSCMNINMQKRIIKQIDFEHKRNSNNHYVHVKVLPGYFTC